MWLIFLNSLVIKTNVDNSKAFDHASFCQANMTPRLRLQMARQTYVEWPPGGSEMGEQLFWAQLRQAPARPSSSIVNSPVSAQLFAAHVPHDAD